MVFQECLYLVEMYSGISLCESNSPTKTVTTVKYHQREYNLLKYERL